MFRRKITAPTSSRKNGYEVGYRKPPKHSQFRPGHSGNPRGRRKGLRNLVTDVKSTLGTPVKVKEGGRTRTRSTQEGVLMVLREKALRGDARALDRFVELAVRFNNDAAEVGSAQALAADDQAILSAYEAEIVAAAMTAATPKSPDPTSKPGASPGKKTRE
jgi:Family of unknown function (DUF5681)